jgi:hypothetical protein
LNSSLIVDETFTISILKLGTSLDVNSYSKPASRLSKVGDPLAS